MLNHTTILGYQVPNIHRIEVCRKIAIERRNRLILLLNNKNYKFKSSYKGIYTYIFKEESSTYIAFRRHFSETKRWIYSRLVSWWPSEMQMLKSCCQPVTYLYFSDKHLLLNTWDTDKWEQLIADSYEWETKQSKCMCYFKILK